MNGVKSRGREQPAVKADFSRENRTHGQFVDHGIAGQIKMASRGYA